MRKLLAGIQAHIIYKERSRQAAVVRSPEVDAYSLALVGEQIERRFGPGIGRTAIVNCLQRGQHASRAVEYLHIQVLTAPI